MKHAYTRRSNVNSKAQANMRTSWNHQCSPDMQCNNTWTMETSHNCKSNTKSKKTKQNKTGFYWKVWENKCVFTCDLNEEDVCVWRMEKGRLFLSVVAVVVAVQCSTARLVLKKRKRDCMIPVLNELHWLPVKFRCEYKIAELRN